MKETISLIRLLLQSRFDLVLDFHGILKNGLLSWLTGSPDRVGFSRRADKECNHIFNRCHIDADDKTISRYEKNHALVRPFLHFFPERHPSISVDEDIRQRVRDMLTKILKERECPPIDCMQDIKPEEVFKTAVEMLQTEG